MVQPSTQDQGSEWSEIFSRKNGRTIRKRSAVSRTTGAWRLELEIFSDKVPSPRAAEAVEEQ
jgi:hypothetical protein